MAELASGAVRSLLGVLRDEAQLLGRVEGDLKFIQEEMESMNSFLQHLDRTTPPRDHDEQVRTWMKQVRDLAYDCSNFIDLHLLRGDPAVYRITGPVGRYLWLLVPWYLQKLYAQHRAAIQLRELKARARDVGKRRLRYDVKIPQKSGGKPSVPEATLSSSQDAGGGDAGIIPSDDEQTPKDEAMRAQAFAEPRILEECTQELVNWLLQTEERARLPWLNEDRFQSIAIAEPDKEDGADVAREALAHPSVATKFKQKLLITFPWYLPATPRYILQEILGEVGRQAVRTRGDVMNPEKSGGKPSGPEATLSSSQAAGGGDEVTIPSDEQILGKLLPEYHAKTEELNRKIEEIVKKTKEHLQAAGTKRPSWVAPLEPLDVLQELLPELVQSVGKDQIEDKKINETAMKIREYLEELDTGRSWIGLDHSEYVGILRELLPQPKENKPVKEATDKLGDDQIANNIKEILQELLSKPQEDKDKLGEGHIEEKIKETTEHIIDNMLRQKLLPKRKEDVDKLDEDQMSEDKIEEIMENIERILENIKEQLLVKEIAMKIKEHLEGKRTIIVLDDIDYAYKWRDTKSALNQLGCTAGSAVIVTTNYTQGSEEFCSPKREAIIYSLVHFYYMKVLQFTSRRKNKDCNEYIFREILKLCEPHELCMKLFAHALYANPDKSAEDLDKLRDTLVFRGPLDINAKKMLMFSYGDLPRDYKTCLLYLAIFPQGHKIRRSTLVGRWVAEGLITKEDWPSSVHRAERCFDELVDRWLVYPCDIGAAGKVKSCTVHDVVHEFITKIAMKEHFVETSLSHHLACHFSVLSNVRLRTSEDMPKFLRELRTSPQYPLVKVLDLEGCKPFKMKQHYLENICKKMLLLKYLSLRNTDITKLPKEINNLHQLEVLDIRHTHVMIASATKNLLLLKLKRLLAGGIYPSPSYIKANDSFSAAQLPHRIGKMTNMEVLSHVEASQLGAELEDIGKLWQLRKLGVVIHDKKAHLENLVQVIGDLESLRSLSISIKPPQASIHGPSSTDISFQHPPKHLESLSISGNTSGPLLPLLLAKTGDQLTKVTLHDTLLNQNDLNDLAELPKVRCVRLRHKSYIASKLTFNKDEFQNLKNLLVEGSNMTEINFEDEAAPELEKIVMSSIKIDSITFKNGAAPKLNEIALSSTKIASITFENGATPNLKKIMFGHEKIVLSSTNITNIAFKNGAAPKLEEIVLSSTNITNITFENGATPNLKKIVLSFTNVECLSGINYLPVLMELELNSRGITSAALHSLFTDAKQLAKVTLRDTMLKQGDIQILLAKQPNLRYLTLLDKSCDERVQLTFGTEEFRNLKLLVVECFNITEISFAKGAAPKLEKIVWSFTNIQSLSGIDNLLELKELKLKGDKIPNRVKEAIAKLPNPHVLKHTQQKNQDKEEKAQQQRILDSN